VVGASRKSTDDELIELLASFENRPYDFAIAMFPWGEEGTELHGRWLEDWQERVLCDLQAKLTSPSNWNAERWIGEAIQAAIKSGKNVGKTGLLSILIWWAFSTKVNTKGRATANTEKQLTNILWSELAKWYRLFLAKKFFKMTATRLYAADPELEREWHFDAVPWSADNPDAWSGLHNQGGRVLMVFDEASGIDDSIWERGDGATREADTQVIWIATSNPTKNFGRFYECFNKFASLWMNYTVDSREVKLTNHEAINKAIALWGEDDDYVKVSFLGEFPDSSMLQLIPVETIRYARTRPAIAQPWEPLILSVDVARFGNNESVAGFRRGKDARSIPCNRWRGLSTIELGTRIATLITEHSPDAVFIDEGGVGGGVVDFVRHLGHSCIGVNFGSSASSRPGGVLVANKRAEMYVLLRDWLREGGAVEDFDELQEQLVSIEYRFDKKQQIQLASKEDMRMLGRPSPDIADFLALTFAYPVSARVRRAAPVAQMNYDPLSVAAFHATIPQQEATYH